MAANDLAGWIQEAAPVAPAPARPTKWEHNWRGQLLVFLLLTAVAAPLLRGLVDPAAVDPLPALGGLTATPLRRQATGFAGLFVILFQMAHALRRGRGRHPVGAQARWSTAHKLAALVLVPLIFLHTGGRPGVGANRLLLAALLALVLVAQAGHVMKALAHDRVHAEGRCPTGPMRRFEYQANADDGLVHSAGHRVHVVLATAAGVLLLFHVFCVYYF